MRRRLPLLAPIPLVKWAPDCHNRICNVSNPFAGSTFHAQIVVQPDLSRTLGELTGQTAVCDAQGRVLGFYSPLPEPTPIEKLQLDPPSSIAETEELRKVRTGKPLSEILTRLGL